MCLIVLAWRVHPELPLVVAANRDEFHARPAAPAAFWDDHPDILAGRDLEARGALVSRFLVNGAAPAAYVKGLKADLYSGFNLLAADDQDLWSMSNRGGEPRRLEPGIYGLGNTLLDAPEVDAPKRAFAADLEAGAAVESLFGVLDKARIVNPQYGTRCSTVLLKGERSEEHTSELQSPTNL